MAKCIVTGAKKAMGNSRTFAMNSPKRTWSPNLQRRRMLVDGRMQTVYVSARGLKTLAKAK
jgi:large subunit ribosomal protein L28